MYLDWTRDSLEDFYRKYPIYLGNVAQALGVSGRGTKQELIRRILKRQTEIKTGSLRRNNMAKRRMKRNPKTLLFQPIKFACIGSRYYYTIEYAPGMNWAVSEFSNQGKVLRFIDNISDLKDAKKITKMMHDGKDVFYSKSLGAFVHSYRPN